MANKQKKKRNKVYRGANAAVQKPTITRVSAVNRSRLGQWLFERKKFLRPAITVAVIVLVVLLIIVGIVSIFTN
ncbi:MAG: hypothetical protein L0H36_03500 [bacterium]|nr:hypothetical protein [bacterium]MDN5835675.1 hypothetical protein [bacterium]